jgi:hypothetical protein
MKKFRINAQEHIIKNVIECIQCSILGQGFAISWHYELLNESTIEFTLKEGKEAKFSDVFWLGYFTATD